MTNKIRLDKLEQKIEDNFESLNDISNMDEEISLLQNSTRSYSKKIQ